MVEYIRNNASFKYTCNNLDLLVANDSHIIMWSVRILHKNVKQIKKQLSDLDLKTDL